MTTIIIIKVPIGIFAFSGDKLLHYSLFSNNPKKASAEFSAEVPENFVSKLKDYNIEYTTTAPIMRKQMREYAVSLGFVTNDEEFNKFLSDFSLIFSKEKIATEITKDKLVIQATNALDDLNKIHNLLLERLHEWYSLHFPEKRVDAKAVEKYGKRENIPGFKESTGIEIDDNDENMLKHYAKLTIIAESNKKELEKYIKKSMNELAPNISMLIDPLLASKLMASTGSLENLAKLPASSIQLIGAEKALFRHMKSKKAKPPKFGLIFMTSYIQNAPNEYRGKIARLLAAKLMLAARMDFYSKRFDPELKQKLDEEIERVLR